MSTLTILAFSLGLLALLVASGIALHFHFHAQRELVRLAELEAQLPDLRRQPGLRAEVERLIRDKQLLSKEVAEATVVIEEARKSREWFSTHNGALEVAREKVRSLEDSIAGQLQRFEQLKEEIVVLRSQKAEYAEDLQQLSSMQKQLIVLTQQVTEAESVIRQRETAAAELDVVRKAVESTKLSLHSLEVRSAAARRTLGETLNDLEGLLERRELLEKEIEDMQQLKRSLEPYRQALAEKEKVEEWLRVYGPKYEEANSRLLTISNDVELAMADIDAARQEREEVQAECREARHQREWLIREENYISSGLDRRRAEFEEVDARVLALEARQTTMLVSVEELQVRLETLRQELAERQEALQLARKEMGDLLQSRDIATAELNVRREEIVQLKASYSTTNKLLEAAVKRWGEIAPATIADDTEKLAELWRPAVSPASFTKHRNAGESRSLEGVESYLKDLGLRFPSRVVRAFHTSLKVAQSSPLTVLAGISGTGKSELPKRYAEGIGMHFVPIAVQPRWDSPQDMFGFYNYLENRYRATELARALLQFDPFACDQSRDIQPPKEWRKSHLSERMLIVLLDEMNLARVEYYFSDFLSKLESRRGVKRDDPLSRRVAEFFVEVGLRRLDSSSGGVQVQSQPSLPVFVDTNVLFVGTMNEDETTQTLSDKVVDRSNILRFGSPTDLYSGALGPDANAPVKVPETWLPFNVWKKWTTPESYVVPEDFSDAASAIERLNKALRQVGRSFAHRTFRSMLAYIANYPSDLSGNGLVALSDQIEMKILPKMRGLDLGDNRSRQVLSEVLRVAESCGDQQLLEAISVCGRDGEYFAWSGVDRLDDV